MGNPLSMDVFLAGRIKKNIIYDDTGGISSHVADDRRVMLIICS
jgi:hypothetical protein